MMIDKLDKHINAIKDGYRSEATFFTEYKKHFPSRSACIALIDEIRALLFPGYFDNECPAGKSPDTLVGERLMHISRVLSHQIYKALLFEDGTLCPTVVHVQSDDMAEQFLDRLADIQSMMLKDIHAAFDGDPAARSLEEILVCYPGIYAIFTYRISHELFKLGVPLIPRLMSEHAHSVTGIDIGPGAQIGEYFFIDHGTGVVIGETTVIGHHAKIYQGVTLGATSTRKGQELSGVKRHPTLGDYVTVYSNASILGGNTIIGDNSVIGGSAFVCESVPANARVFLKNQEIAVSVREQ